MFCLYPYRLECAPSFSFIFRLTSMYPSSFLKIFYKTMKLESTSTISPTIGGSHCHRAYSILFDGLEWAKCVKQGLL